MIMPIDSSQVFPFFLASTTRQGRRPSAALVRVAPAHGRCPLVFAGWVPHAERTDVDAGKRDPAGMNGKDPTPERGTGRQKGGGRSRGEARTGRTVARRAHWTSSRQYYRMPPPSGSPNARTAGHRTRQTSRQIAPSRSPCVVRSRPAAPGRTTRNLHTSRRMAP